MLTGPDQKLSRLQQRVGVRIKAAREAAGLSQSHVAHQVGMTRSSIANLEAGRQDMSISRLALVAAAVNLNLAELIQPEDLPGLRPPPPPAHDVTIRPFFAIECRTCDKTIDALPDRTKALEVKRAHIAAMRDAHE